MSDIEPVPAATVVLVRQSPEVAELEVLLLQRNSRLVFHGGHWVFPGGRIDQKDFKNSGSELEYPAALKAAVRETKEEAGIEIDESQLIHTAHWTTPPKLPRRFCTWFFICPLFESVSVSVDNDEILDHRWISPSNAIADAEAEEWVLPRPTLTTLSDIVSHKNLDDLVAAVTVGNIRVFPKDSQYYRPAEMGCPE
ncbi:MAG: NUDIX hydrolase [Gammaproteobacteria bacterium]|nr:NUDIX hydrolase [Gammaproteobacteria bacterium]MDD9959024.1 NUDIX hydrolase [Gammaproteobacteria bacterium]